jgi:hypothetical protein
MGLSWQQGPLSPGATGCFLVPEALPQRLRPLPRRARNSTVTVSYPFDRSIVD